MSESLVRLLVDEGVIKFGPYVTKAGRRTPYFCDFGALSRAGALFEVAQAMAARLMDLGVDFDTLYGPAYKGIPLGMAVGQCLRMYNKDVHVVYNRKEIKDHGEGGVLVGHLKDSAKVVILEDVLSAGTSLKESIAHLSHRRIQCALVVLDREEKADQRLARDELQDQYKFPIWSLLKVKTAIPQAIQNGWIQGIDSKKVLAELDEYWKMHRGS